jgi:HNH endonuclease
MSIVPDSSSEPVEEPTKRCPRCETVRKKTEFGKCKSAYDGLQAYCKPCMSKYVSERNAARHAEGRDLPTEKYCSKCNITKPISEFRVFQSLPQSYCRDCQNNYSTEWMKEKRRTEPEVVHAKERANYEPYKKRERAVKFYQQHKVRLNAELRAKKAANPDRYAERQAKYLDEHGTEIRVKAAAKRKHHNPDALDTLTGPEWKEILRNQHGLCLRCYRKFTKAFPPTRDHVVSMVRGGALTKANTQGLCRPCNAAKGQRYIRYLLVLQSPT